MWSKGNQEKEELAATPSPKVKHFCYTINEYAMSCVLPLYFSYIWPSLLSTCPSPFAFVCLWSPAKTTATSSYPSSSFGFKVVLSQLRSMVWVRKGFVLKEAENYSTSLLLGASDWWKDIDESEDWQACIYCLLCAAYILVSLVALVLPFFILFLFVSLSFIFLEFTHHVSLRIILNSKYMLS